MLNELENKMYLFNYTQATGDWNVVMNETTGQPQTIPTGPNPTDVKVQLVNTEFGPKNLAYITNAGNDTLYAIDTEFNTLSGFMDQTECDPDIEHYPTSIDTRGKGDRGYSADFHSGTVSVYDLVAMTMYDAPNTCEIDVGEAPIRIVVQPWVSDVQTFQDVRNVLAFAQPTDFTTPSKQSNLIRDWENVHQLEQTPANPQAVVSNIKAFQGNVEKWVTNAALKKSVNEGVNLYRAAYIHDHPIPRQ